MHSHHMQGDMTSFIDGHLMYCNVTCADHPGASDKPAIMSRGLRSMASAGLLCLLVIAVQLWGVDSAWGGLWSVMDREDGEQRQGATDSGVGAGAGGPAHVQNVVPGGVHRVPGGAGAANLLLRRNEQERTVMRTLSARANARRGRFLAQGNGEGVAQAINVWPTDVRGISVKKTCDVVPALCQTPEQIAIGATTCCNKKCVNIKTDSNNCGRCSNQVGHGCVCCDGKSVDLKKDVNNCGRCGNVCKGPNPKCSYSMCNYNTRY